MSIWRQVTRGLRGLLQANRQDQEIGDEVRHYFEEATEAYRARGLSEEEARRAARLELGNPSTAEEQVRAYGWENAVRTFSSDLRFGARQLRRNPSFTAISVITLALGIGASTAIFSAINPILFKPLPYPDPGRVLMIWNSWQGARSEIAYGTWLELSQRSHSFEATAFFEPWQPAITGGAEPRRLEGQSVSAGFFHVLGVAPLIGRDFRASDERPNRPKVVILSDRLWRQFFGADPAVIGRAVKLDGDSYTVIAVMPGAFDDVLSPSAELWTPDQYDSSQTTREFNSWEWGNHLRMVGRVRPGVSRNDAAQELAGVARSPWPQFPRPRWASLDQGLIVDSLQDDIAHTVRPAMLAVFGAVMIVLTIACVNVTNLLLARSAQRAGEFAVRGALGASRGRITRQLVTESLFLTCLGGTLGIAAALAGVRAIVALSPPELPRLDAIRFDTASFLFASVLITIVGLVAGTIPALHISRNELQSRLQRASRRIASGHLWTRRLLVVAEFALALVLLVSAGLLLRSMQRLLAVDPGFSPSQMLTVQVVTSGHQFDETPANPAGADRRRRFFEQALDAVRHVPGVESAAFTSLLPLSDDPPVVGQYGAQFDDQDSQSGYNVFRYAVSPGYCQTMRIPLVAGRLLDERDTADAPQAALISESLARRHFGNRNPIGSRLHVGPRNRPWYTVVGIVGDVKQTSLSIDQEDAVYLSTRQTWFADDTLSFVIRARGNATALVPDVKSAVWSVDKDQPIVRILTMDRMVAITEAQRRFVLILFEAFGIVALVLAGVGLYGVLAGSISERIHEIGVRMAMGATRGHILTMALRDGMRLTALGIGIGACAALAASRGIVSLLFGTSALDLLSWVGVLAVLAFVSVLACWVPAWRAANVDPSTTLRSE
ncbi:MAG TPA: ABC transporter permease [Verrucomicrobiae bacterium]|nr:ABC transporter permease [Verrucomicrobiae bacterium]